MFIAAEGSNNWLREYNLEIDVRVLSDSSANKWITSVSRTIKINLIVHIKHVL